jgi:hypothetical protein
MTVLTRAVATRDGARLEGRGRRRVVRKVMAVRCTVRVVRGARFRPWWLQLVAIARA